jgi:hypothetical protein
MDAFLFFICYNFLLAAQKLPQDLQLECISRAYHPNIINLCPSYKCPSKIEKYLTLKVAERQNLFQFNPQKKYGKIRKFLSKNMDKIL